jgi:predicted nucleic acid-binding Zn ribbon protein
MQRMTDPVKRKCEACGALALERLISQTSFQLKGGGWYKDLYSSPKPAGASKSEGASDSAASSDSGSTAKSDGGSNAAASPPASKDSTKPAKKAKRGSQ